MRSPRSPVNLAAAIATAAGPLETLVTAVKNRERQLDQLRSAMSDLEGRRRIGRLDQRRVQQTLEHRLRDWQGLASRHMSDTRRILGTLLEGRILFTPHLAGEKACYEFVGQASLARVLSEWSVQKICWPQGVSLASPQAHQRHRTRGIKPGRPT
jgi:hypothetical protein